MLTSLLRARGTGGRRGRGSRSCSRRGDGRGREQALQGWRHRVELVIEHLQPALGNAVHILEAVAQPVFLPLRLRPQQRRRGVRDTEVTVIQVLKSTNSNAHLLRLPFEL